MKTQQGNQEFLMKWKGWPTKFNSCERKDSYYIPQSQDADAE